MRVERISGGEDVFRALTGQMVSPEMTNYFANSVNSMVERLGNASQFITQQTQHLYDRFNNGEMMTRVKEVLNNMGSHIDDNVIVTLTPENMMFATPMMQQYIMVEPTIYDLYQNNACSGFNGGYIDIDPVKDVTQHALYNRVMDGFLQEDVNGDVFFTTYDDTFTEPLQFSEQNAIMTSWRNVKNMINAGLDPTSPDGEEL